MTTPNSLYDLAKRSLHALDENSWPQLRDNLRHALNQEDTAQALHKYSLQIAFGGTQKATVYFSIEAGDLPDEWVVSAGAKVFYQGIEITELFEGCDIDEQIYTKSDEVEQMMADAWADHMIDQYESSTSD